MGEMQSKSDAQLLREYAEAGNESAFAEIVTRHTDLVYSAAMRQVPSSDLACDVAQNVFASLARGAGTLAGKSNPDASLAGWLCRCTRNLALNLRRDDFRRHSRERQAMEDLRPSPETAPDWDRLRPVLDEALANLNEADHDALVMRFFKNQDLRSVGLALGVNEDTAQKRVSRALEKLREYLAQRGITTTAAALAAGISANAVQAAPAGLAAAISATAALAGTTAVTATATATKVIAMTTLQKTIIAATIAAALGAGIYGFRRDSAWQAQVRTLQQKQAWLSGQMDLLQRERDAATNRLAAANEEIGRLKSADKANELLKLRGQVGVLRQQLAALEAKLGSPSIGLSKVLSDPAMRDYIHQIQLNTIKSRFGDLFKELKLTPEQAEQVVRALGDQITKNSDKMYALPQGSLSADEIAQTKAEQKADLEQHLQSVLGEAGCARLIAYTHEFPAQATIALLNGQLGANQLNDDQTTRLSQIVKAEPYDLTRGISGDWDPAFWGPQEYIDDHLQQVGESNQRILQQAGGFLTPDQMAALTTVLTNGVNDRIAQAAAFIQKH